MSVISAATNGDAYLFGGVMRRSVFGDGISGDLDVMIPNGDDRAWARLDGLGVPFVLNSQGLRKYRWGSIDIDLFHPREFFGGFDDVADAVKYFDLRINALALHIATERVLDPFDVLSRPIVDPGINWPQWDDNRPEHRVHLAIRLTRIMYEAPTLTIAREDTAKLKRDVLPHIESIDWAAVAARFPEGRDAFRREFEANVLDRMRVSAV